MRKYKLSHIRQLEAESIHIMREVAAQFENPVLMFSGGKDSITMAKLAQKAFWPGKIPFPFLHVDTGHNFDETLEFRDNLMDELGVELIVAKVQDLIDSGEVREENGPNASRNKLQIPALLKALEEHEFDAAFGGARRDEEKARAKERFFSHRDEFGQWDPKNQRPELWNLYNGKKGHGEHFRVFPLSNWTEMDVWQYIAAEDIDIPDLYLAHEREVVERADTFLAKSEFITLTDEEEYETRTVRFRTIGDMTCTGAFQSDAATVPQIIEEVASARITERGNRTDDKRAEAAMEERKKQGYF
ncbi:sulfate adenylyltransferase subunit CysD [Fodinibius salsisoli]|uniref:Sulfate adenylyltransferase subunit 2 n=1 Tax=Fodinibius salsisoli TaxID=2820877 RepID=A0ABT3PLE7_9BACT|nr:sulfate adenylyltransferase subunit CysD [Fodinibius salsisoli]MCW9706029.1 sulfate adenylyltransferase subunit CysD [Fodinibius salsisoli]